MLELKAPTQRWPAIYQPPEEITLELSGFLYTASTWAIPILVAITFHEAAHAYAAWKLGDDTAFRLGRVTLNPLKHVDPFGTVLVPTLLLVFKAPFLFGWAKPVPVAFGHLSRPRRDMALVALAGPLTNVALALAPAGLFHLVLAIFNMIPLPPLDGGRVVTSILPGVLARPYAKLERYGFLILLGVIFILPMLGRELGLDLNLFRWAVSVPLAWVAPIFFGLAGIG